jgi:hypothetical protein
MARKDTGPIRARKATENKEDTGRNTLKVLFFISLFERFPFPDQPV